MRKVPDQYKQDTLELNNLCKFKQIMITFEIQI